MKYQIVDVLNNYLETAGRNDLINPSLDCHSAIALELSHDMVINIDLDTDDIILWAELASGSLDNLSEISSPLLLNMLQYDSVNFPMGQPTLTYHGDVLILSAVLGEHCLSHPDKFSDMMEEFYERYCQLLDLVK